VPGRQDNDVWRQPVPGDRAAVAHVMGPPERRASTWSSARLLISQVGVGGDAALDANLQS
jgi:hypothetical protein